MKKTEDKLTKPLVQWWHWISGAVLIILFTFLSPRGKSPEFAHLTEGSISQSKIIAPFDFEILKSSEELEAERKEAAESILPVVINVDSVGDKYRREILVFSAETHKMLAGLPESCFAKSSDSLENIIIAPSFEDSIVFKEGKDRIFNRFRFRLAEDTWRFLLKLFILDRDTTTHKYFHYFEDDLEGILRDVYGQGIVDVRKELLNQFSGNVIVQYEGEEFVQSLDRLLTSSEALEKVSVLLPERLDVNAYPKGAISAAYSILQSFIYPNIIYNSTETKQRRHTAIANVPLARGYIYKNELIIDSNIRVTLEHLSKLNSLAIIRAERESEKGGLKAPLPVTGHLFLVSLIITFLGLYLALVQKKVWNDWKLVILIAVILILIHLFQVYVPIHYGLSRYLFPAAVLAMLLCILINIEVATAGVIVMAMLSGLLHGNDFPATFSAFIVGSIAILSVRHAKTRGDVMRTTAYLVITYIPLVSAFHFVQYKITAHLWYDFIIAGSNALLSPILVLGLVFIFENLFRITTDLSLLELVDLNRPLLRELAIKSPGTYHHSIMVGSLAESAAQAIGANALLARAGAYYHDIGKIDNQEYFIENQETGSENIHDRLPPSKSVEIIKQHVSHGLELADKYRLPPKVKAFINEHHGRTQMAYFYTKAVQEMGDDVNEESYRYPGPKPMSKETGILMLADIVEAATRIMEHATHDELSEVINTLIQNRLTDGDLDDCPLTMQEIGKIKETFVQVVMGIHHQRIPYPKNEE